MNRRLVLVAFLFITAVGLIGAQEADAERDPESIYVATVDVERVYPHPLGYRVVYIRSDLYPDEVYLPGRWFTSAAGKGEIMTRYDDTVPYMQVYYFDGEFSHVRLFVHGNPSHRSWGALPGGEDLSDEFSIETLEINY